MIDHLFVRIVNFFTNHRIFDILSPCIQQNLIELILKKEKKLLIKWHNNRFYIIFHAANNRFLPLNSFTFVLV
jgi:hypothetical protein